MKAGSEISLVAILKILPVNHLCSSCPQKDVVDLYIGQLMVLLYFLTNSEK